MTLCKLPNPRLINICSTSLSYMFVNMVVVRIALLTPVMKVPAQETRSGAPTEPAASSMATENARANGATAAT